MRIAHISDLHILHLENIQAWRYLGKRSTGGLNLLLKRRRAHRQEHVIAALEQIQKDGADHIVVTGDLSNLAFESEFAAARALLLQHAGGGSYVSVIPGNHDYYTWNSARTQRFESWFSPWMQSDLPGFSQEEPYPWIKLLGEHIAVVGVNSCIPSPPLFAVGRVGAKQRERLAGLLARPELKRRFVIVALHHHLLPPLHTSRRKEMMRRLIDADATLEVLRAGSADLVIHGHNHQWGFSSLTRPHDGLPFYIAEAGSTSAEAHQNPHFGPKFNLYDIELDEAGSPVLACVHTRLYDPVSGSFSTWQEHTLRAGAG